MSVTISIYDFFAYTIPGGLYLFTVLYACTVLGFLKIDWVSLDLSLLQIIILTGLAYILGLIFEPVAKLVYERLFKRTNLRELAFQEFRRRHPSQETKIRSEDWPILLAYIKRESMDVALDIERHNATNMMLRNVSFGLICLSLVQIIRFALTLGLSHCVLAFALAIASIVAGKESVKFGTWFFFGIFESIASHNLQIPSLTVWKQDPIVKEGDDPTTQ